MRIASAASCRSEVGRGYVEAEGDLDFRGTLGVSREVPVGFAAIRLVSRLETRAEPEVLKKLGELAERYCVVYQTLRGTTAVGASVERLDGGA
jgi:uncharacterized OsmC-like protein